MDASTSAEQLLDFGSKHGSFILGAVALGISTVGGAVSLALHVQGLKKDLEHERELRKALEQRTDLVVKNQLFDILHHADYQAATRLLHRSEAAPAARPSTE
jgi:ribosomal protein S15P/S13E